MENSGDQETFIVSIVDDVALDDERANAVAELWPVATHVRLFDEQLESIEDGVDESIGPRGAGILGDVQDTDGIAVTSCPTSRDFPRGLFVVQDGDNSPAMQNFKLFAWEDIAAAGLLVETNWSLRRR